MKKSKWVVDLLFSVLITAIAAGVGYYFALPALNIKSVGFWLYALAVFFCFILVFAIVLSSSKPKDRAGKRALVFFAALGGVVAAGGIVCLIASARLFHAKAYSQLLAVDEERDFNEDLSETLSTDAIAIMDTDSARMLGNRKLGSLSGLVSQYNVSEDYSQINYRNTPMKAASLEYAGFFKYIKNRGKGVPGYVLVSPVDMSAKYVELEKNMNYVPSACFGKDLKRHIRSRFKTQMLRGIWFEIDEDGNPYYVAPVYDNRIGLFGGSDVTGAILVDPVTGAMDYFDAAAIPDWVDIVYDGDLLCSQYDDYGKLRNGFWNSKFSAEGCKVTTEDYGYIAMSNDIWVYTGVTSVNSDASNIGFVLMNERTKEARFYAIPGADEDSAMTAAEGEVQQYGYQASFPSLINVDGSATYIMVLKDSGGLVKLYAAVNAEQYNIVATASGQKECIEKYRRLIKKDAGEDTAGEDSGDSAPDGEEQVDESLYEEKKITVQRMEPIVVDGDTWLYVLTKDGELYHAKYVDVLDMLGVSEGDKIRIRVYEDRFLTS